MIPGNTAHVTLDLGKYTRYSGPIPIGVSPCNRTESRGPAKRTGIRIGKDAKDITMVGNRMTGFAIEVEDRRAK